MQTPFVGENLDNDDDDDDDNGYDDDNDDDDARGCLECRLPLWVSGYLCLWFLPT